MYEESAAATNAANGVPFSDSRQRCMRNGDHAGGEMGPVTQGPRSPRAKIAVTLTTPE